MDPNACYDYLVSALRDGRRVDALEHYRDLCDWLRRGGFAPRAFSDIHIRNAFYDGYEAFRKHTTCKHNSSASH